MKSKEEKSNCCGDSVYYQLVKTKAYGHVKIPRCHKCMMVCISVDCFDKEKSDTISFDIIKYCFESESPEKRIDDAFLGQKPDHY